MEYYENEDDNFTNLETEYPAIVFDDISDAALSCKPTVSPLDNNEIDFNISFDESDDEEYMIVFDKNSFSCKIISVDNLKTNSENENDKINIPSSPSPEPMIGYFDDLDFFKDFENEFPTIVYNDLKSKSDPNESSMSGEESAPQMAQVKSPHVVSSVKLPILKKCEYTLWSMRMEQYLTNTDYALWQVIMNGNEPVKTTKDANGVETEVPPKTAQALLQRQRERKAKSILLLAIPNEYQLRFHGIKDSKTLWAAIKSRFGGNVEAKKMQKNVL
ncbi:hypothetical protein Tco_1096938 [Tanacetum coccineum]